MRPFPPLPDRSLPPSSHPLPQLVQAEVGQKATQSQVSVRRGKPRLIPTDLADIRRPIVNEFLRSKQLSVNTRRNYERELLRFLSWTELSFRELTTNHLSHYRDYLVDSPWRKCRTAIGEEVTPLKNSSVNVALSALRTFFEWLELTHEDLLVKNPMRGLDLLKVTEPGAQALSDKELARVWTALSFLGETQVRDTALIHVLNHGLRADEAVSLNLGSILEQHQLFIAKSKNNEQRQVPLNQDCRAAIAQYLQERQQQGELLTPTSPLFLSMHPNPAWKEQRLSYHGVYLVVEKVGAYAEISTLHPHRFRHTYATNLLRSGVDPTYAKILTGHKDERSFRRYVKAVEQEEAIKAYYRAIGEDIHTGKLFESTSDYFS